MLGGALAAFKFWEHKKGFNCGDNSGGERRNPDLTAAAVRYTAPQFGAGGGVVSSKNIQLGGMYGGTTNDDDEDFDLQFTNTAFNSGDEADRGHSSNHFHFTDFTNSREVGIDVDFSASPSNTISASDYVVQSTAATADGNKQTTAAVAVPPRPVTFELISERAKNVNKAAVEDGVVNLKSIIDESDAFQKKAHEEAVRQSLKDLEDLNDELDVNIDTMKTSQVSQNKQKQNPDHKNDLFEDNFIEISRNEFDEIINKRFEEMNSDVNKDNVSLSGAGDESEMTNTTTAANREINNIFTKDIEDDLPELFGVHNRKKSSGSSGFGFDAKKLVEESRVREEQRRLQEEQQRRKRDIQDDDDDDIDISIDSELNNFKTIDSNAFKNKRTAEDTTEAKFTVQDNQLTKSNGIMINEIGKGFNNTETFLFIYNKTNIII